MKNKNIYFRKDGRYEGRIYETSAADGKKRYRSVYGKTREEVENKLTALFEPITACIMADMSLSELISEWFKMSSVRIKESTAANYLMKIEKHILPEFGKCLCSQLQPKAIYSFIEKKTKDGLSARYISDILVLLKSVFRYAARQYNIKNVLDGIFMPKKSSEEVTLLNNEEQAVLKEHLNQNPDLTSMGISISLNAGLRIGEICSLKWENVDLEKRILTVSSTIQRIKNLDGGSKTKLVITAPKSKSSCRSIPIPDCLMPILKMHQGDKDTYVMTCSDKPLEPRTLQYRFSKLLDNVGLPSVRFHSLRHLFATRCVQTPGFDIKTLSEILGHGSVEITLNKYVHSSMERKRSCMALLT